MCVVVSLTEIKWRKETKYLKYKTIKMETIHCIQTCNLIQFTFIWINPNPEMILLNFPVLISVKLNCVRRDAHNANLDLIRCFKNLNACLSCSNMIILNKITAQKFIRFEFEWKIKVETEKVGRRENDNNKRNELTNQNKWTLRIRWCVVEHINVLKTFIPFATKSI